MTTPTEDLVAELREMGESVLDPLTPTEARAAAAIMRAAEVIEAQAQEIYDLGVALAAYTDVYGLREDDEADGRA